MFNATLALRPWARRTPNGVFGLRPQTERRSYAQAASAFRSSIYGTMLSLGPCNVCINIGLTLLYLFLPPQLYSYYHVHALVMLCGTGTDILSYRLLYLSYPSTCSCT